MKNTIPIKAHCTWLMCRYRDACIRLLLLLFGFQVHFLSILASFQHLSGVFYK